MFSSPQRARESHRGECGDEEHKPKLCELCGKMFSKHRDRAEWRHHHLYGCADGQWTRRGFSPQYGSSVLRPCECGRGHLIGRGSGNGYHSSLMRRWGKFKGQTRMARRFLPPGEARRRNCGEKASSIGAVWLSSGGFFAGTHRGPSCARLLCPAGLCRPAWSRQ